MDARKRSLLKGTAALLAGGANLSLALPALAQQGAADTFPSRPITMVIGGTPGSGSDTMGRLVAESMGKDLGQPFVMDYKAGAGGQVAAAAVARAAPDGYTVLLSTTGPLFYTPHMTSKLPYDARRDFTYLSQITDGGLILLAGKDVPATNINELVAWIRQQGKGKVHYGSYGVGTVSHLLSSYLSDARDLGMSHVAYRGEAPFIQDLLAGQIPLGIGSIWTATPHIASGKLRGIAVFTGARHPGLPNVPTMVESGYTEPELKVVAGLFLVGPANMPASVVARIEAAARKAMNTSPLHERFVELGTTPVGGTAGEARALVDTSQAKLARLVQISGARLD